VLHHTKYCDSLSEEVLLKVSLSEKRSLLERGDRSVEQRGGKKAVTHCALDVLK
jgi:hypothetical protein